MSGTTTLGFPYPELTDDPNGAAQMQALAEAVDTNFQWPATPATVWSTVMGTATVGPVSGTGFTSVGTVTVTTTGAQTLLVTVQCRVVNVGSTTVKWGLRVQDLADGTATVWRSASQKVANTGVDNTEAAFTFLYTTPSGGARDLRVQCGADTASSINVVPPSGAAFNSDSTDYPLISAAVIK